MSAASRSRASSWQVAPSPASLRMAEIRETCGEENPPNSERPDEKGSRPVGPNQHEGSARSSARRGVSTFTVLHSFMEVVSFFQSEISTLLPSNIFSSDTIDPFTMGIDAPLSRTTEVSSPFTSACVLAIFGEQKRMVSLLDFGVGTIPPFNRLNHR